MLNVGTLVAGLRLDKGNYDQELQQSESRWDSMSSAINAAAAASAAAGAAAEGYARKQLPLTEQSRRIAASIGEQESQVRDLAVSLTNVTRPLDQVLNTMEVGRQQGLRSTEQLEKFVVAWDTVGDATGENADELAKASPALNAVGIGAENVTDAYTAFGFIQQETTHGVGEFMEVINRIGPEIRTMGLTVDDTAAVIGAMQGELGATGRVARREFQQAVREADGDLNVMLSTLGLTGDQFEAYRGKVAESAGVIERNAQLHEDSYTVMQRVQSQLEVLMFEYGTFAEAASMLSPILIGGGGVVFGLNQAVQAKQALAASTGTVMTGLRGMGRFLMGPWGIALAAGTAAVWDLQRSMGEARAEVEATGRSFDEHIDRLSEPRDFNWSMLLGPVGAYQEARDGITELRIGWELWRQEANDAKRDVPELTAEVANLTDAERSMRLHMDAATEAAVRHSDELDGMGDAANDTEDDVRLLNEMMREFAGDTIDADRAAIRFQDALDQVADAAGEAGGGIDISTEAGRANREAVMRATEALWGEVDARLESGATIEELIPLVHGHIDALEEEMRQAGLTEDEIQTLIEAYGLVPSQVTTRIEADDRASSVISNIRGQLDRLTSRPVVVDIQGSGSIPRHAHGGRFRPGLAMVGEDGPELVRFDGHGEVFNAATTDRMFRTSQPDVASAATEPAAVPAVQQPAQMPSELVVVDADGALVGRMRVEAGRAVTDAVAPVRTLGRAS